jgi:hypothetical protein
MKQKIMGKSWKILTIIALYMLAFSAKMDGEVGEYLKYFRTDSAYVYNWNSTESVWLPGSIQLYNYENGRIVNLLAVDYFRRIGQAKTEYSYNTEGLLEATVNYYYNNGWMAASRNLYFYNAQQRISEIHIQKWINYAWTDDRKQLNYNYDISGHLTDYQLIYWRNDEWTSPTTDYSYFDEPGRLIRREAIYPDGSTDYQVIYNYGQSNLLSESYAQYPSAAGWQNWWRVTYEYTNCIIKKSQIQYISSGNGWIPNTKTQYFTYFRPELWPDRKAMVCHEGQSMYVRTIAVQNHLNHGDCIGPCPEGESSEAIRSRRVTNELKSDPFTIYPNPASDRITLIRNSDNPEISKIEVMDMNGNILRSVSACDAGDVTIGRDGLISGQYIVRIYGDQIYSLVVVFN